MMGIAEYYEELVWMLCMFTINIKQHDHRYLVVNRSLAHFMKAPVDDIVGKLAGADLGMSEAERSRFYAMFQVSDNVLELSGL